MKKILILQALIFNLVSYAQQWVWSEKATSTTGSETPYKIRKDSNGNVYMLGMAYGNSKYGNSIVNPGAFVVKFNGAGMPLWAVNVGPSYPKDITVDSKENVAVTANFQGTVTIGSFTLANKGNPNNGCNNFYVVKLNKQGNLVWAQAYGGFSGTSINSILFDSTGNLYMTGAFRDSVSFGSVTLLDSSGTNRFYLTKLDSTNNVMWATNGKINFYAGSYLYKRNQFIYVCGYYYNYGFPTGFIAKYNSNGNLLYDNGAWGSYSDITDFAVDNNLNLYVLYNGGGHYYYAPILAKYDSVLNNQWTKGLGYAYGCMMIGSNISLDDSANCYVGGYIGSPNYCNSDTIIFEGDTVITNGHENPVVIRFSTSGSLAWLKTAKGFNRDRINYVSSTGIGECVVIGGMNGAGWGTSSMGDTLTFDSNALTNDGNWYQIFVAKTGISFTNSITEHLDNTETEVYPNPCNGIFTVRVPKKVIAEKIYIYNIVGNCILNKFSSKNSSREIIDISGQPKGMYFIELFDNGKRTMKKIVLE